MSDRENHSTFDYQTPGEEIANAITHGIGALLSVAALVLLVVFSARKGDAWRVVSFSVYGATLILLYTMSVLSHAFTGNVKRLFELFDFSAVYLLIAGTYTPIALVFMRGPWGWTIFGIIWALAVLGVIFKVFFLGRFNFAGTLVYIAMGWLIIAAFKPLVAGSSAGFIKWLVAGGVCYTLGTFFYLFREMPYHHPVWHLFVLAGSMCHFFGFMFHGL